MSAYPRNDFFAQNKYGPIGSELKDVTSFAELGAIRRNKQQDNLNKQAAQLTGHQKGLGGPGGESTYIEDQDKHQDKRKKITRVGKALAVGALTAATATAVAPHMSGALSAINHRLEQDRVFHPEQGNDDTPTKVQQQMDHDAQMSDHDAQQKSVSAHEVSPGNIHVQVQQHK